jgi:branched-chain amino acid transport system substrate-binding protein
LLVKAARESGLDAKFYTFYGNSLGAPAAIGEAGVGRVLAVAEWHPNAGGKASDAYVHAFRATLSNPRNDYQHLRTTVLIDMLAAAMERAKSADPLAVARALEGATWRNPIQSATMRAADHQLQQPVYVTVMRRKGEAISFDNEGSGYGFKTERLLSAAEAEQPTSCQMTRP